MPVIHADHARSQRSDMEADRAINMLDVRASGVNRRIHRRLRRTCGHECGYRGGGRTARHFLDKHSVAFRKLLDTK